MKKKWKNTGRIFVLIGHYEPLFFLCIIPQIILSSITPILSVYFPKRFIEQLTGGKTYGEIVQSILLFFGMILLAETLRSFLSNKKAYYVDRFSKKVQYNTGCITMSMRLSDMEGSEFSDKLWMANHAAQITDAVDVLQNIVSDVLTIAGLSAIILRLDAVFVMLVCIVLCVKILFVYLTYRHNKKRRKEYAANDRIGNYLNRVAYFDHGAAKELRINSLKDWFMNKVRGYRNEMLNLQYGDFRKYAVFESISAFIVAIQSFVILSVLAIRVVEHTITIADFTMYFSAVTVLTEKLSAIVIQIGEYSRIQLSLTDYRLLLQYDGNEKKGMVEESEKKQSSLSKTPPAIEFANVSFAYPNSEHYVLKNINLRIEAGEKLSIVGENGAGKSTLIKLLCRFYKPTDGKITVGGVDLFEIPEKEYNRLISSVFQDFQNFAFTVKENVLMGNCDRKVEPILYDVGLGDLLNRLTNGSETDLTRMFNANGVELSGGENQKLAIARAICKDSPIFILDEPTAALDPKAESEIYDSFFQIAQGKTTIFISHRLASSTVADKIAVLKAGTIIEYGTHSELLKNKKEYAKMFEMQSRSYDWSMGSESVAELSNLSNPIA